MLVAPTASEYLRHLGQCVCVKRPTRAARSTCSLLLVPSGVLADGWRSDDEAVRRAATLRASHYASSIRFKNVCLDRH
jgi:hypothetical protein